jgi:hypothetical protein
MIDLDIALHIADYSDSFSFLLPRLVLYACALAGLPPKAPVDVLAIQSVAIVILVS